MKTAEDVLLEKVKVIARLYGVTDSGEGLTIVTREDLLEKIRETFPRAEILLFNNLGRLKLKNSKVVVVFGTPEVEKDDVIEKAEELLPEADFTVEEVRELDCLRRCSLGFYLDCLYTGSFLQRLYVMLAVEEIRRVVTAMIGEVREVYVYVSRSPVEENILEIPKVKTCPNVYLVNVCDTGWSLKTLSLFD
ncbi:MAG: hypothetical protein DRJ52_09570 [Thermoprotei archaeon]|nr:MAG: hypothetical protein DRJ52_09570 [Thermoprotei archaeon]